MTAPIDPYLRMALNNAWANRTLFHAIRGLDRAAFTAPRPGFFGSLGETLNHIHEVDLYYIDALEAGGLGRAVYARDAILDAPALARAQAEADRRLIAVCHGLSPDILTAHRVTERADGPVRERVDALLLHLFQHQVHHRGQAHVQAQDAGVAPPQLDDFHLDHGRAPSAAAYMS